MIMIMIYLVIKTQCYIYVICNIRDRISSYDKYTVYGSR